MKVTRQSEEEDGKLPDVPLTDPPISVPSSLPPHLPIAKPSFATDTVMESKAISVARNECSSALPSPAEASPAKPAVSPTSILEQTFDQSPATSQMASASDSSKSPGASSLSISDSPPWVSTLPPATFGSPEAEKTDFPAVSTFKGVSVTLENNSIWKQFCECGTEMILTKQGRRMFPYCRYRLSGSDPDRMYSLVSSIVPSSQFRYRWNTSKWEVSGPTEHQPQGSIRAFPHHYSPCRGSEWMSCLVSFYKLKLTNYFQDQEGHMISHSMHRYIPRLHIIPVSDGVAPTADKPVVMGPESITFTFPQTEFMAVTTYQNFRITQSKINHNPFAKGFREDGNNPRLNRILPAPVKPESRKEVPNPAEAIEQQEEVMDLSLKSQDPSAPSEDAPEPRSVSKPIMSNPSGIGATYVPCMRGKHASGEIVLQKNQPPAEPKTEDIVIVTPKANSGSRKPPRSRANLSGSSMRNPGTSTSYRRRKRRKVKRRWTLHYGRSWKTVAASPKVASSPSSTVAMQPESDDIEGSSFVSFTSKEALEVHVKDKLTDTSSSEPADTSTERMETTEMEDFCGVSVEENPETLEEKTARSESLLLDDSSVSKHRQVIHPVSQEVGLKLSSLDPTMAVDLKYSGVCSPLPPSSLYGQSSALAKAPADEESPFISRTGKTRDVTKIKGWRSKFTTSQETSASNGEGEQKNLSAFCSNMLDEYLENEAQQISERAAAFATHPEDAVAYQSPAKSSSYVKTSDSALRHRHAASKVSVGPSRPCPLSRKSLPPSPGASPTTSEAPSQASEPVAAAGAAYAEDDSQRLPTSQSGANQRVVVGFGQGPSAAHRAPGLSKIQLKSMQMEATAFNQGLSRTHSTPERVSTASSVISSEQGMSSEIPVQDDPVGPECGQEFCRSGCVCHSSNQPNTSPDHCRQPECMFACSCLRPSTDADQSTQPRFSSNHAKSWNRNIYDEDLEPLYAPKAAQFLTPVNVQKSWNFCPAPPMREEDKDPVYKYSESKMTCARVREYNSSPPPVVTLGTEVFESKDKPASSNTSKPVIKQENHSEVIDQKPVEKPSQDIKSFAIKAKKQIQIQSMCQWKNDRKMLSEGLCERMNRDRLHRRFYIGPYCISPVTRIVLKKPSGNLITYRIQISKPDKVSDCEDHSEDDKKCDVKFTDGNSGEDVAGAPVNCYGAILDGRSRASKKPPGRKASGLIQVNGKYYDNATSLLGNMGSSHPANRLAAHVTSRLQADKFTRMKRSTNPTSSPEPPHVKATRTFFPPFSNQKTTQQPKADLLKPPSLSNVSSNTVQDSQKSQSVNPSGSSFVPIQQNIHSSSTSSPVSLTVSPSSKSPSFLAESGTYSFRICPPSAQTGQQPSGVASPGGFTLIQLMNGEQAKPADVTSNSSAEGQQRVSNLSHLAREWVGFDTFSKVRTLLGSSEPKPEPSSGRLSEEKKPSGGNGEKEERQQMEKQQEFDSDMSSEELSSDFSDYDDCEEDDEVVDIETVEAKHGEAISKMREEASVRSQRSRDCADDGREPKVVNEPISKYKIKADDGVTRGRRNHSTVEKSRRCEQRVSFDRSQTSSNVDSRTSRSHVLASAVKEVESSGKTFRYLQAEKQRLLQARSVFVNRSSVLAGKPESSILSKSKEIFERQKQREREMKWKPVFSHLLQSKAALLQATAPPADSQPLVSPQGGSSPPDQANSPEMAEQNFQKSLSSFQPFKRPDQSTENKSMQNAQSNMASIIMPDQIGSAPQSEAQQREPGAFGQAGSKLEGTSKRSEYPASLTNSAQLSDKSALTVAKVTPGSSAPKKTTTIVVPSRSVALPSIRSKTGRLILPSSSKPFGQGYYTSMVMESQKKEGDEASSSTNPEPSVVAPSKSSEKATPASEQPLGPESKCVTPDITAPSDSDPKSSGAASPLADLAFLNNSLGLPPIDLQANEENRGKTVPVLVRTLTGQMCLKPLREGRLSSDKPRQHRRGRSSKGQASNPSTDTKDTVAEQTKMVKRGRGRPAGKKTTVKRGRSQDSDDDSPVKFSIQSLKSPSSPNSKGEANSRRPQTRGSSGKDFPSAKKRSWIDVERESEPDLDFV